MKDINRREMLGVAIGTAAAVAIPTAAQAELPNEIVATQAVQPINMGLGELANPSNVFVRQFRFLFWFDHMGPEFNHSIKLDRVAKEIRFKNYEIATNGKVLIQDWIDAMVDGNFPKETMTL